jgi:hypothetical protein|tara:strand:- start:5236 stop:5583 length:348 start_codon:yes stop_codon:yes gene_type:complete
MSLYQVQKFLYHLNRDEETQQAFSTDKAAVLSRYDFLMEEYEALHSGDIGLLYVLGVNGQILMHYAAFLQVEWFDYLQLMREGVDNHGPVRAGIYAMTAGGEQFAETLVTSEDSD